VLSATGIVKSYRRGIWPVRRGIHVLRGVDIALEAGEVAGLVGASRDRCSRPAQAPSLAKEANSDDR